MEQNLYMDSYIQLLKKEEAMILQLLSHTSYNQCGCIFHQIKYSGDRDATFLEMQLKFIKYKIDYFEKQLVK
jgi:hypothetical protein